MNPKNNFHWNLAHTGARKGFPLLWFHGFMGSGNDWTPFTTEHFSDYHNILVDLPGHGRSSISGDIHFQKALEDLGGQLMDLQISSFVPIGYSMGGRVALHLQQTFSNLIPALIGISAAPGLKTKQERALRSQADTHLIKRLDQLSFPNFLEEWYQLPLFQSIHSNTDLIDQLMVSRSTNNIDQLGKALNLMGNGALPSLWKTLTNIKIQTLLLSGSQDSKYCKINEEMVQALPQGQHIIVEDGDHAFHLEKPLETARLIRQFLREITEGDKRGNN